MQQANLPLRGDVVRCTGPHAGRAGTYVCTLTPSQPALSVRVDETLNLVQASVIAPAREGRALLSAFRAAFRAVRDLRHARSRQARGEEEDALFI